MRNDIKIGDIVETCSLMPGIVMTINGDDLGIRMLDQDDYFLASCSLSNCGIVKISSQDAMKRLFIGKDQLGELWIKSKSYEEYVKLIESEYNLMTYHNSD